MDRRHLLLLSLAGLASAPALAQSPSPEPAGATPTPSASNTPAGGMSEAERDHIRNTLMVGGLSLELSRLAASRASQAKVKEFAAFEIAEQETIAAILKPMMGGQAPSEADHAAMVKKLQDLGSGFDVAYVAAEIEGHDKLLKIQNDYIQAGKSQPQVDMAKLARGMILEHQHLLADLKTSGAL